MAREVITGDILTLMAAPTLSPFHPRTHHARKRKQTLGLREAIAMAVGGMIGGGIFSVLGVTVDLAGHLAFGVVRRSAA